MKKFLLITFVLTLLAQPVSMSYAQGTFQPSGGTTDNSSGAFDGMSFSGVGAAVSSCLGVEDLLTRGIGTLQDIASIQISSIGAALTGVTFYGINIGSLFGSLTGTGTGTNTVQLVKDEGLRNKESCLDKLAYVAGQKVLAQMTVKTLNWVNTGFDGNPLYARDINSLLTSIKNEQIAQFLPDVQKSDPIFGNALRSIITKQVTGKTDGLLKKAMNTPEAVAYNDFMTDFTKGGWGALLNTSNNPLSALFRESGNLATSISNQAGNTRQELISGDGFLDMKKCVEFAKEGTVGNENGVGLKTGGPRCLRYESLTPGSIIADQVKMILGSPVRQAENIDELNELFAAFFDNLLNNLFSKNGLAGLKNSGAGGNGGTSQGNNVVFDSLGNPLISSIDGGYAFDDPSFSMGIAQNFDISRPQMLRSVLTAQNNFLNRSGDTVVAGVSLVPQLGRLDYCMPGPNSSWQEGITGNLQSLVNSALYDVENRFEAVVRPFPALDKLSGDTKQVNGPTVFVMNEYNDFIGQPGSNDYFLGLGFNISGGDDNESVWRDYFQRVGNALGQEISTTYNINTVPAAFGQVSGDSTLNRGTATTAYRVTESLLPYSRSINSLLTSYTQNSSMVRANITELEAINQEVQELVRVAKARYIAERAAAGNPVNMACIDGPNGYIINQSPVTGVGRQESDTTLQTTLSELNAANNYFYSTL